jgi:DNA-binding MarR family transcriptional regulator
MANFEHEITLGVLNAVHDNSHVTQRSMAGGLGIALGLTNSYIKRCIKKGLVKVQQVPANRYAYYLTQKGFTEKSRLTRDYLTQGFQFFRIAREQCLEIYTTCGEQDLRKITLYGLTDLAEIAVLCASDQGIELTSIIAPGSQLATYSGISVFNDHKDSPPFNALIVTDLGNPQQEYDRLVDIYGSRCIFTPALLKISVESERPVGGEPS